MTTPTTKRLSARPEAQQVRLADLADCARVGDRERISSWFRRLGNHPDASYQTPLARKAEMPRHREHLVPVRVLTDRLLAGTLTAAQARAAVCIVDALAVENSAGIAKMMGKGGKRPIYKALLACPPARLVEVAAWRYLSAGIRLNGLDGRASFALTDHKRLDSIVERYARKYDREHDA